MSPPCPPSPPEGPPRGTYFSLRNATQPLPPSPAFIEILASSANTNHLLGRDAGKPYADAGRTNKNTRPGALERVRSRAGLVGGCRSGFFLRLSRARLFHGEYADVAAVSALIFEQDDSVDQREEAVVFRQPNVLPGLIVRAALANQNAAAGYELAAKPLDSKSLTVRVASISG